MPAVILTRTAEDNARVAPLFRSAGITIYSVPMIELRPIAYTASELLALLPEQSPPLYILLTSAHATRIWLGLRASALANVDVAGYYTVGERSAGLLQQAGEHAPVLATAPSAEELAQLPLPGAATIFYPCSAERRDTLVDALRHNGTTVIEFPIYTPSLPEGSAHALQQALAGAGSPIALPFFSPSAVRNFFSLSPNLPPKTIWGAIGPTTASALQNFSITTIITPPTPSAEQFAPLVTGALHSG